MKKYDPPRDWADVLKRAGPRPPDSALREDKKNFAERRSRLIAEYLAVKVRELGAGFSACRPGPDGGVEAIVLAGSETKKVDVSLKSRDGLVLVMSVKTINHPSPRGKKGPFVDWQRNLANRTGDLRTETASIHKRHPYAVVAGFFAFEAGADRRIPKGKTHSTFAEACRRFAAMSGRSNPKNEEDRFEHFAAMTYDSVTGEVTVVRPEDPLKSITVEDWLHEIRETVRKRNVCGF